MSESTTDQWPTSLDDLLQEMVRLQGSRLLIQQTSTPRWSFLTSIDRVMRQTAGRLEPDQREIAYLRLKGLKLGQEAWQDLCADAQRTQHEKYQALLHKS